MDESTIEMCKSKETLELFYSGGYGPVMIAVTIHLEAVFTDVIIKELDRGLMEETFLSFEE